MQFTVKIILSIAFTIVWLKSEAQISAEQYIFSSVGIEASTASGLQISGTIGEAVIATGTSQNFIATQGFHQPSVLAVQPLLLRVDSVDASCYNEQDGYATVTVLSGAAPYTYAWSNGGGSNDTSLMYLPGQYSVTVMDANNSVGVIAFTIGSENGPGCDFTIYSGFTPNGDGVNDQWIIDGIEYLGDNEVLIYDRWGGQVWEGQNYDNSAIVWDGSHSDGRNLPSGTYFYIVRINAKSNAYKGWVHLTE